MRHLVSFPLFCAALLATLGAGVSGQQPDAKKTQSKYDPPKAMKPDEATLKQIAEKTEQLRKAIEGLKVKNIPEGIQIDVKIYLKAAENIVRFEEWYSESSAKWAIQTLDQGLVRAKQAEGGKPVWLDTPGKWVVRAYESYIDQSIQPYAVLLPHDYGKDPEKKWRLDVVLHGRDSSLTEAKFIASHGTTTKEAAKDLDHVQLEVYGRGNNAYRWAGEKDVFEAFELFAFSENVRTLSDRIDMNRIVLRGFSMGGAGTWHLGLHHPFPFAAIGPGAGFTTTHGYVGGLPKELPDYQEKCLRIYDAVDYAENAFNVPVVAYSGSNDPQKAAADNIEKALKGFKEPLRFTHLVAPGLEHQMPKEWQDKAQVEYKKQIADRPEFPERVRFVTYTTGYNVFGHGEIEVLQHHYERAVIDSHWTKDGLKVTTENIAAFMLQPTKHALPEAISIDGQTISTKKELPKEILHLEKDKNQWRIVTREETRKRTGKDRWLHGPIDDCFTSPFRVVVSSGEGCFPNMTKYAEATYKQFSYTWDKYFRGKLPITTMYKSVTENGLTNLVLFGDPESNPMIAKVLPKLPITWTREKLVVNGVEYDPKTHIPVLIYPNPLDSQTYVVLNSGHTFHEADFKGTNALLYPRLGDWAVIKPKPTAKDPAAHEVIAAGLFDEQWQFPKKK
jgi:predicted esterase